MINYLIKQGMNYLHADKVTGALCFQTFKEGASLYLKDEADMVLNTMKKAGMAGVFKIKVKNKFVSLPSEKSMIARAVEKHQKKKARQRLSKN